MKNKCVNSHAICIQIVYTVDNNALIRNITIVNVNYTNKKKITSTDHFLLLYDILKSNSAGSKGITRTLTVNLFGKFLSIQIISVQDRMKRKD